VIKSGKERKSGREEKRKGRRGNLITERRNEKIRKNNGIRDM
jgi:hypothetical protein